MNAPWRMRCSSSPERDLLTGSAPQPEMTDHADLGCRHVHRTLANRSIGCLHSLQVVARHGVVRMMAATAYESSFSFNFPQTRPVGHLLARKPCACREQSTVLLVSRPIVRIAWDKLSCCLLTVSSHVGFAVSHLTHSVCARHMGRAESKW